MKLKSSIIIALLFSVLLPLVLSFYYLSSFVGEQQKAQVQNNLAAVSQLARNRILSSVDRIIEGTALVSSRTQLRSSLSEFVSSGDISHIERVQHIIDDAAESIVNIKNIAVFDSSKVLVASSSNNTFPFAIDANHSFPQITLSHDDQGTTLSGIDQLIFNDAVIGYIQLSVTPNFITEIVEEGSDLGKTGEWILAIKNESNEALFVSPTRYNNQGAFNRTLSFENTNAPIIRALNGEDAIIWGAQDYAGNTVVAATRYIADYEWGIVAKINQNEVMQDVKALTDIFWFVLAVVLLVVFAISLWVSHYLAEPLETLTKQLGQNKEGDYQALTTTSKFKELEVLAKAFNDLLKNVQEFNQTLNKQVHARTSELAIANKELSVEKHRAELATAAKSIFLANMSHEVRTPLNSIYGSLQLLRRMDLADKPQHLVKTANYSIESLLGIINQILDFSKIEDDAIELENVYFDFSHICKQINNEMNILASKKEVLLSFSEGAAYQEGWIGDPLRIKQILVNFVSNAIKFSEKGSVDIFYDMKTVNDSHFLEVSVKDHGTGMTQEVIDNIYTRFSQADTSTTRKYGGTGLGMPISLGLVKLMQGEIKIESEVDKGTIVRASIPLKKAIPRAMKDGQIASLAAPDLSNKIILLAEDNEINQIIFCTMLEETKAKIVIANNGLEAVELFNQIQPDIVFLDIQMPEMDGVEACNIIRPLANNIPLVSITANVSPDETQQYRNTGFDYQVGKPVELQALYKILWALLERE